jgi:hypothetical protein
MEPHTDFAVALTQHLPVSTGADPGDGHGPIEGHVVSLGWWVQPGADDNPDHEPAGTLYVVVGEQRPRPMWVRQAHLTSVRLAR